MAAADLCRCGHPRRDHEDAALAPECLGCDCCKAYAAPVPALSTSADVEAVDPWRDEVRGRIAPLLAGRDLRTGGSFVKACDEIADALRPVVAALSTQPTEGTTVTEWGFLYDGKPEWSTNERKPWSKPRAWVERSRAYDTRVAHKVGPIINRQRIRYPDRVTEWTEVTP